MSEYSIIQAFTSNMDEELDAKVMSALKNFKYDNKYKKSTIIFFLLTLFYLGFGIALLDSYLSIKEVRMSYDDLCTINNNNNTCLVNFNVDSDMNGPVYFFYEIQNFYQNHRKYMHSFSYNQFKGNIDNDARDCWPVRTNEEMEKKVNLLGEQMDPNAIAFPCGLIAKTVFNDTFSLKLKKKDNETNPVEIREHNLVSNLKDFVKLPDNYKSIMWNDTTNEHLLIWMKISVYPKFRKLWGIVDQGIQKGNYELEIKNNYDVTKFSGKKYFIFTTKGSLGFKNLLLVVGYLVSAFICLILMVVFFYFHRKENKEKMN